MSNYRRELLKSGKIIPKTNLSQSKLNTSKSTSTQPDVTQIKNNISKLHIDIHTLERIGHL